MGRCNREGIGWTHQPEPLALTHLVNQPQPEIIGVQFHFEDVLLLTSVLEDRNNDAVANIPVDPHQACTRLGNILLVIFFQGTIYFNESVT